MGSDGVWHRDQLRIADFYLLFFFRLQSVRLAPKHKAVKALARKRAENRYEHQPDDHLLFDRMEPIQRAAIETLIAKSFFSVAPNNRDLLHETERAEPEALARRIDQINSTEVDVMEAIQSLVNDYELLGKNGLKDRTGLLEFRYDAI